MYWLRFISHIRRYAAPSLPRVPLSGRGPDVLADLRFPVVSLDFPDRTRSYRSGDGSGTE